jgi:hypothetical protein
VFMSVVGNNRFFLLACMMKIAGKIGWWIAMIFKLWVKIQVYVMENHVSRSKNGRHNF